MMWPLKKTIEVYVCSETDEKSLSKLNAIINEQGGIKTNEKNSLVGSQDITFIDYKIQNKDVSITIETYAGVTLSGAKDIVNMILTEFKK